MAKRFLFILLVLALMIWAAGCSDDPTSTAAPENSLSDDFGGYTATNEAPGFGDPILLAAVEGEAEVEDPLLAVPSVAAMVNDVQYGLFHFRAVWGRLEYDSTVTTETDWTGSLTVNAGALIVRRLIRFEPEQDALLPRTDRKLVEWQSVTTVHNDGIAVDLLVPPRFPEYDTSWVVDGTDSTMVIDTIPPEPVTLTFEAGSYSRTFTLNELAQLSEVVTFDDGNAIAFHAVQFYRHACPRGVLAGFWGYDDEGAGIFKGIWFSGFGRVTGFVEGNFGKDDQDRNVFYGKWIDASGQFEGLLRGTWGHRVGVTVSEVAQHRGAGWYAGDIFDASGNEIGALRGHFKSSPFAPGGWFQGRWKLTCPDAGGEPRHNGMGMMNDGI